MAELKRPSHLHACCQGRTSLPDEFNRFRRAIGPAIQTFGEYKNSNRADEEHALLTSKLPFELRNFGLLLLGEAANRVVGQYFAFFGS